MSSFSIIIVEDELLIAEMLSDVLHAQGYQVSGIFSDVDAAVGFLNENPAPDLAIIDINLESSKNGFDLALVLREKYQLPFVFLTSYSDLKTINDAIGMQPEAYLLKPFKSLDIFTTIEIIRNRNRWKNNPQRTMVIKDGNQSVKIDLNEVVWMKSDNVYVEVHLTDRKLLLRKSLDGIISELNSEFIVRTHRSYAVNLFHLKTLSSSTLNIGEHEIPVSRTHKQELYERFHKMAR